MRTIPLGILGIFNSLVKFSYLKNKRLFLNFLFDLWNLHQILDIFESKMIVIANVFSKLQTVQDLVLPLSRKRRFTTSLNSQRINGCEWLAKSAWEYFYHVFWSLSGDMIQKISLLLKFEIVGVFPNTLTARDKCPVEDFQNFQFPIQMELS